MLQAHCLCALSASKCKNSKECKSFSESDKFVMTFDVALNEDKLLTSMISRQPLSPPSYRRTADLPFVGLGVVRLDQANMLGISLGPNRLGFPLKCALQTRVYSLTCTVLPRNNLTLRLRSFSGEVAVD